MRLASVVIAFLLAGTAGSGPWAAPPDAGFDRTIRPFLAAHCFKCHGPRKTKGDLRLDQIRGELAAGEDVEKWQKVREQLREGEMPPEKQPRPRKSAIDAVLRWIEGGLARAEEKARTSGGRMVIRRLNRTEYDNTIRDLFGVDLKPARVFPEDDSAHGFDNIGSALSVSPLLFEKYLNAAQWITRRTIFTERPKTVKHHWKGTELAYGKYIDSIKQAGRHPKDDAVLFFTSGPQANGNRNHSSYPVGFRRPHFKTPVPGEYIFRVRASAIGGGVTPKLRYKIYYEPKHLENFPKGDLGVILKVSKDGEMFGRIHIRRTPEVYERRTFAEAGQEFMYNFENGSPNVNSKRVAKDYPGPGLVVHWIEVEGPVFDRWPPASHARIFFRGADAKKDRSYARQILGRFARKAYRRPVKASEVDDLLTIFDLRLKEGESFERSVAAGMELALCSPSFLYLTEPAPPSVAPQERRRLNAYELASRLSYFLWSSMPDGELFKHAGDGSLLRDPGMLEAQVRRMLKDPKAGALTTNFVGQWLKLRKLKAIAVDQRLYPSYSDYLKTLFRRESEVFFEEILKHDLSVLNFIDSDFMMLNDRLAVHYGVKGIKGHEFRRVPVKDRRRRGGLTAQSGILTLTTCGTRTSPVMRGAWVLEAMLGIEPPPPPKEVPALTPDTRGRKTIRERLAAHRADPSCAPCHDKIDPFGLALENYNVIGIWRDDYGKHTRRGYQPGTPVDASATLATGEKFTGPKELRDVLMKKKDRFCRSLVENLLTYALGRGLDLGDRRTVETLTSGLEKNGYKLSDLILGIVKSQPFETK